MTGPETHQNPSTDAEHADVPLLDTSGSERIGDDAGFLWLEITRIHRYDRNPRHTDNPAYARIKASIRADGLAQPLVVTRRPGEQDYRVAAGGNTRLQILRELHAETGEERFMCVPCLYRPWTGEADVLLAHLKENDLRGDLSFLDKARAVVEIKRLIRAVTDTGEVTQTELAEVLKARGYGLTQGRISQLEYTVETLLPLLPEALQAGLGRPQVEHIRGLERAARGLWSDRVLDDDYETVFASLCRRYDAPEWDIDILRRALEAEIAERAGISLHAASMALEARLAGRSVERAPDVTADEHDITTAEEPNPAVVADVKPVDQPAESDVSSEETESAGRAVEAILPPSGDRGSPERHRGAHDAEDEDVTHAGSSTQARDEAPVPGGERLTAEPAAETSAEADQSGPTDLKSLRARAWTLARRLAQRHGIGALIAPVGGNGLGYLLRDVPDTSLTEALDEEALAQVSAVWWVLAACAETTVAPLDQLLPAMADGSVLKQALQAQDAQLLFSRVWTPDPGHMGNHLWRLLDERGWRELVALMETYRKIHHTAEATGVSVWGAAR